MYWTNDDGSERQAFTVRFTGSDTGTVKILGDATVEHTAFDVNRDQIRFTLTRLLDAPVGDWSETSVFEGSVIGSDRMLGAWTLEAWSCQTDPEPSCAYTGDLARFSSRLVRQ
jgi:hypothetical protein